ncbi:MAG: toprim domain-containing protein [Clostridia bacterium]|nr:toprim domain-containing protein [Clostridia bacterium]
MINSKDLKLRIYEESLIGELLEKIGMHNIRAHNQEEYYTCGMPDGDNENSTTVYNDENIGVVAYTRNFKTDIIGLVQYTQKLDFTESLKWISSQLQLDNDYDLYSSQAVCEMSGDKYIRQLQSKLNGAEVKSDDIKIRNNKELNKYTSSIYSNISDSFAKDNISEKTQKQFNVIPHLEVADLDWNYTAYNNYDVIPIYDEIGCLVGAKARLYGSKAKYIAILPYKKSQYLYGLFFTKDFIDRTKEVIVCEAEKGVMQLWEYGYKNSVATSGHDISDIQIEKLLKLDVDKVVVAYDEDIREIELCKTYRKLKDLFKEVTCIIDKKHILNSKESPMDNSEKWEKLYKECQYIPNVWSDDEC